MRTFYLKQLKSGNYRRSTMMDYSVKFNTKKSFIDWYLKNINGYTRFFHSFGSRLIKTTYSQSQTYYPLGEFGAKQFLASLTKQIT